MPISQIVWNAAKALTGSAPTPIADGGLGAWSVPTDLSADTDDFTQAGVQVEFSVSASTVGTVNWYIADSSDTGLLTGGQNEPATLTRIGDTSINGNALNYTTRIMNLNYIGGVWPPNFILKCENQSGGGATVTIVSARYRTAFLDTT